MRSSGWKSGIPAASKKSGSNTSRGLFSMFFNSVFTSVLQPLRLFSELRQQLQKAGVENFICDSELEN